MFSCFVLRWFVVWWLVMFELVSNTFCLLVGLVGLWCKLFYLEKLVVHWIGHFGMNWNIMMICCWWKTMIMNFYVTCYLLSSFCLQLNILYLVVFWLIWCRWFELLWMLGFMKFYTFLLWRWWLPWIYTAFVTWPA